MPTRVGLYKPTTAQWWARFEIHTHTNTCTHHLPWVRTDRTGWEPDVTGRSQISRAECARPSNVIQYNTMSGVSFRAPSLRTHSLEMWAISYGIVWYLVWSSYVEVLGYTGIITREIEI